jgi:hypothetical protein
MADRVKEKRTYQMQQTEDGWELTLFEGGLPVGGAGGGPDDYSFLLATAEDFCG